MDPLATDLAIGGVPGANLVLCPVLVTSESLRGGGNSAIAPIVVRGLVPVKAKLPWPDVSDLVRIYMDVK